MAERKLPSQPHCHGAVFLCDPVCPQPFSQRRGLGRKGEGGGRGRGGGEGGRDIQGIQPLETFPKSWRGPATYPTPTISLWPVSLGGQVLFKKKKKKDEILCPGEQSCVHTVQSVAGCESCGEGPSVRLLLFGANEKVALGTVASRECLASRAWRASQAKWLVLCVNNLNFLVSGLG